jgi:hypothetical protein
VTYVDGHSWIADWSGASEGDRAAQYWADLHVQTGNPMYAVPGMFASLWTPDTALKTAFTLGTAGGASVGFRFGREITFGRTCASPRLETEPAIVTASSRTTTGAASTLGLARRSQDKELEDIALGR